MIKAVLVCPGRGTYNRAELGYLREHFRDRELLDRFDRQRCSARQPTLGALDGAARFSSGMHTRGDNASALIYAATIGDFLDLDRDSIEIVAVTGNSMGWYSALACSGAVHPEEGFRIANTMGTLMQHRLVGGQLVYPFVEEDWRPRPERREELLALVEAINLAGDALFVSIELGGMLVLAGEESGLAAFERKVPVLQQRFPMRLPNHAAFHSPLVAPVAVQGRAELPLALFGGPSLPLIDGRGAIWWPGAAAPEEIRSYTLGHQVVQTYDFTRAITVAAREFMPDLFIVTGPGTTLGSSIAQSLIMASWRNLTDRDAFRARQDEDPVLLSMGLPEQRMKVTRQRRAS